MTLETRGDGGRTEEQEEEEEEEEEEAAVGLEQNHLEEKRELREQLRRLPPILTSLGRRGGGA